MVARGSGWWHPCHPWASLHFSELALLFISPPWPLAHAHLDGDNREATKLEVSMEFCGTGDSSGIVAHRQSPSDPLPESSGFVN